MEILFLLIGLACGSCAAWLIFKYKTESSLAKLEERNIILKENLAELDKELDAERARIQALVEELATTREKYENLSERLREQKAEIEQMQDKFKTEFKNIANELLEDKSKKFTEQNKINLSEILNPLGEKIRDFEKKVEQTHKESLERNAALRQQLSG